MNRGGENSPCCRDTTTTKRATGQTASSSDLARIATAEEDRAA